MGNSGVVAHEIKALVFNETAVTHYFFTRRQSHFPALVVPGAVGEVGRVRGDSPHRNVGSTGCRIRALADGLRQQRGVGHRSFVPDAISVIHRAVGGIGGGQHLAGHEIHHVAVVRVQCHTRCRRDRLRRRGCQQGDRGTPHKVKLPHRSIQITGINRIDRTAPKAVDRNWRGQAVRAGDGAVTTRLDSADQLAGVGVDDVQVCSVVAATVDVSWGGVGTAGIVAQAIVETIADNHRVHSADRGNRDRSIGITEVDVGVGRAGIGVAELGGRNFPHGFVRDSALVSRRQSGTAGNVQRVQPFAAGAQAAGQYPLGARQNGRHIDPPVHVIVVHIRVCREVFHLGKQHRRYVSPALLAAAIGAFGRVDGMQHAVVGADKNRRVDRIVHEQRAGMDHVAKCGRALAQGFRGDGNLIAAVAAQEIKDRAAGQVSLLRRRQAAPAKRHIAAVVLHGRDQPAGVEVLCIDQRPRAARPERRFISQNAGAVYRVGEQGTTPELPFILAAKQHFVARLEAEVGHVILSDITDRRVTRGKGRQCQGQLDRHRQRDQHAQQPNPDRFDR